MYVPAGVPRSPGQPPRAPSPPGEAAYPRAAPPLRQVVTTVQRLGAARYSFVDCWEGAWLAELPGPLRRLPELNVVARTGAWAGARLQPPCGSPLHKGHFKNRLAAPDSAAHLARIWGTWSWGVPEISQRPPGGSYG